MAGHAPYIMPDGRSLSAVLRAEASTPSRSKQGRKKSERAKDELWGQLQHSKRTTANEQELAEIRAIERVGHRRRRQWLNDKLLRDLAGPMSTADMESQFKPVPFGFEQPPSVFTLAAAPQHAALWDHFRSIDSDKEARVLQVWEDHIRSQQQQQQHPPSVLNLAEGQAALHHQQQQAAAAAAALARWARVERSARAALKKASVHAVLSLEMQALQLLEQEDADAQLMLELPDSFGRLLVHGLAQFHGLTSTTCVQHGNKQVILQRKPRPSSPPAPHTPPAPGTADTRQPAAQPPQQQDAAGSAAAASTPAGSMLAAAGSLQTEARSRSSSPLDADVVISSPAYPVQPMSDGAAADWLSHAVDITCTDVVMALQELGGSLNQHTLGHYMKTLHGSVSDVVCA